MSEGLLWWLSSKESTCNAGDLDLIPGAGHGNPLQYSCLANPMDRGAWWATAHGVTKSQTRLRQLSIHTHPHPHTHTHVRTRRDCSNYLNADQETEPYREKIVQRHTCSCPYCQKNCLTPVTHFIILSLRILFI